MFTIVDRDHVRTCEGLGRRQFLRVGSLALGGLSLPGLLESAAQAAGGNKVIRDRAVVLLFLQGGPPQIESFDPKPNAPENSRSCTGEVQTSLPGLRFGGTFPRMGKLADRLAVVHSFASGDGGHNQQPVLTGNNPFAAPMGAVCARATGPFHPRSGVPSNVVVVPEAVAPDLKLGEPTGPFTYNHVVKNYLPAGRLGPAYDAFLPGGGARLLENLTLRLPRERFDDRKELLGQLDGFRRKLDRSKDLDGLDEFQKQAFDVLARGVAQAFDLSKEDPRTVGRYDTTGLLRMEDYHKGGKEYRNLRNQSRVTNLLGKQMLLARRLCEVGCRFVTVVDSCWDFHGDGNNPPTPAGMQMLGPQTDHAVAAFLEDLRDRGLDEKVLLIITGEMGRSPNKGKNGGTGHHANLTPLVLAGGGLKTGQVIGRSDARGSAPATERYTPANVLATVLHTMFDPGELRITPNALPAEVTRLTLDGQPIKELF